MFLLFAGIALGAAATWAGVTGYGALARGRTSGPAWNAIFVAPSATMALFVWSLVPRTLRARRAEFALLGLVVVQDGPRIVVRRGPFYPWETATFCALAAAFVMCFIARFAANTVTTDLVRWVNGVPAIVGAAGLVAGLPTWWARRDIIVIDDQLRTIRAARQGGEPGLAIPWSRVAGVETRRREWGGMLTDDKGAALHKLDVLLRYSAEPGDEHEVTLGSWPEGSAEVEEFAAWLRDRVSLSPGAVPPDQA